jgi:hypothetical protein
MSSNEDCEFECTSDELSEDKWRAWIAHTFAEEMSDSREDIYTLNDLA